MAGARYVLASEIPENRKIDEPLVKDLTGGDAISARYLFSNPFTFARPISSGSSGITSPRLLGPMKASGVASDDPFNVTISEELRSQ